MDHGLLSRGPLACARSGRLFVLPILACMMCVLKLSSPLLRPALSLQVSLMFSNVIFALT